MSTLDPRAAKLLAMREPTRDSTDGRRFVRCGACGRKYECGGVCPDCHPVRDVRAAKTIDDLKPIIVTAETPEPPAKPSARCATCQGRLNSFNGRCPRCEPPAAIVAPPVPDREPEPAPAPEPVVELCWCGREKNHGGWHQGTRKGDAKNAAGKRMPQLSETPPAIGSKPDPELAAVGSVMDALRHLSPAARRRVLDYATARMCEGGAS